MFSYFSKVFLLIIINEFFIINNAQICTEVIRYSKQINIVETFTEQVKSKNCNIIIRLQNKCFATIIQSRIRPKTIIATRENQVCCKGYLNVNDICEPVCSSTCLNSKCTSPDFCTCNIGFEKITANRCDPVCENCNNGKCISPENCVCDQGYEKNNTTNECVPYCSSCENGICIRPGECECNKGYRMNIKTEQEQTCLPICEPPCENSDCVAPNKCNCHLGYKYDNDTKNCNPFCSMSCVNGDCISPNICECWKGFSLLQNSTNICQPIKCINGTFNENGTCICNNGFIQSKTTEIITDFDTVCEPICSVNFIWNDSLSECISITNEADEKTTNILSIESTSTITINDDYESVCNNGYIENGYCKCDNGFHSVTDLVGGYSCESDCDEDCHNAICTGINECTCLEGFQHNNTIFECFPICKPECINGFCVSPNQCECYDGFQHSYNESVQHNCEPTCGDNDGDDCINGTCISPNVCKCFDGFELSGTDIFNCVQSQDAIAETLTNMKTGIILGVVSVLILLIGAVLVLMKYSKRNYNVEVKESPIIVTYTK